MVVEVKVKAFRNFATNLASQLVEQLCLEFEREVQVLYGDCSAYRGELGRVATLLSDQVQREKVLHDMMSTMQFTMNAALGDSSRHEDMKSPLMAAEQELNRVMQLLSQPMIPEVAPKMASAPVERLTAPPAERPSAPPSERLSAPPMSLSGHPIMPAQTEPVVRPLPPPQPPSHGGSVSVLPATPRSQMVHGMSCSVPSLRMLPPSPGPAVPGVPPMAVMPPPPQAPLTGVPPPMAAFPPAPSSVCILPTAVPLR